MNLHLGKCLRFEILHKADLKEKREEIELRSKWKVFIYKKPWWDLPSHQMNVSLQETI